QPASDSGRVPGRGIKARPSLHTRDVLNSQERSLATLLISAHPSTVRTLLVSLSQNSLQVVDCSFQPCEPVASKSVYGAVTKYKLTLACRHKTAAERPSELFRQFLNLRKAAWQFPAARGARATVGVTLGRFQGHMTLAAMDNQL